MNSIGSTSVPDFSLVIPCYNEEEVVRNSVERVVEAFRQSRASIELVLVDNGSRDRTREIIDELIAEGVPAVKETVKQNQGYGYGVICGLQACRGRLVGVVPADLQVDAHDIFKVYQIASTVKTPHLVKVRRRFRLDGLKRKLVSICFNAGVNVLFGGLGSIDVNGNPKVFPREYLEKMKLQSFDWFIDAEILIKAKQLGLPVLEFNVLGQMREGGQSNVHATTCLEFVKNLLAWRFGRTRLPVLRAPAARGRA